MATYIDKMLLNLLKGKRMIKEDSLESALQEAEKSTQSVASILVKKGLLPEEKLLEILAQELKLRRVDLKKMTIDKTVIDLVPLKIASYYKFMPLKIEQGVLTIAVAYPLEIKIQDEIRVHLGYQIECVLASEVEISDQLKEYYGLAADTIQGIIAKAPIPAAKAETRGEKIDDIEKLDEEESVTKLVNQIIVEAYKKRATDIHVEPYRGEVRLRYRIDGILYEAPVPTEIRQFYGSIISRFKIMSNLNIVERRLPQDGRAVVRIQEQVLDLRISSIPTPHDESLVIRILPTKMLFGLEKLGLSSADMDIFKNLIKKPYGIIFVTGPTGSGKTTTLYTCLSTINAVERKIITIEDPIEYELKGVTQMQVMPEIGLTFARGLRSMLRHDPDVIMVGEVRDFETAEIAIRTALTGHLVFSTLHTNDAASAVIRLMDIGIGGYLIGTSVQAFIAQRLVRLICPECKIPDDTQPPDIRTKIARELGLDAKQSIKFFKGKGCKACNGTGFWGRTAIYEILLVDDHIREMIYKKASSDDLKKAAMAKGMHTLRQDGWRKVAEGLTTPEEILNLTQIAEETEPWTGEIPEAPPNLSADVRNYQRLRTKINLMFRLLKAGDKTIKTKDQIEQFVATQDISAGGLLFITDNAIDVGAVLDLRIDLPDTHPPMECLAKIVRLEEIKNENNKFYKVAVCFLDLSGSERIRLDQYILEESHKS